MSSALSKLTKALDTLAKKHVYVGIPAEKASRKEDGPNNAELAFLATFGSPINNIPARPFLDPAIKADGNRQVIQAHMENAAKAAFAGDDAGVQKNLELAGTAAANAAKRWFVDPRNGFAPNTPETIARKGSDRPLIDHAEMRGAITYVVTEE